MARKLGILASLCILAGVWIFVEPSPVEKKKDLLFEGTNLGWIGQLDAFESAFTIRNNSDEVITIDAVDGSCTCLAKLPKDKIVIEPKKSISIPYSLKVSATPKLNLGEDFAFKIWTYVNYHKNDGGKRISTTELTGKVHKVLNASSEYMYFASTHSKDGVEESHGSRITFEAINNVSVKLSNLNKLFSYREVVNGSQHTVDLLIPPSHHGEIEDTLFVKCNTSNGDLVADKHIPVRGYRELFSLFPKSLFMDGLNKDLSVLIASFDTKTFFLNKIQINDSNIMSKCNVFDSPRGKVVNIPLSTVLPSIAAYSSIEFYINTYQGKAITLRLIAHHPKATIRE